MGFGLKGFRLARVYCSKQTEIGDSKCVTNPLCAVAGYVYSGQLKVLEEGSMCNPNGLPREACVVRTTLNVEAWQKLLQSHPDEWFKKFIRGE